MFGRLWKAKNKEEFYDALSHHGGTELYAEQVLHRQVSGVEELDGQLPKAPAASVEFPLHRAAFENDTAALVQLLPRMSTEGKLALDPQGNTALHVAVLRGHTECIKLLMDAGVPPDLKNRQRWTAIDEAVAMRDPQLTKLLYSWLVEDTKRQMREKKAQLLGVMQEMEDFSLQLRWELGSPLFGLLLRRYAPDDTYTLRKVGTKLRVDGSLMGVDHEARSLLPTWKRGSFSLVVDAATSPATMLFIDHGQRKWVDMTGERKSTPRDLDQEVRELLGDGATKVKWKSSELAFQQAKTWLGRPATEKVEGWNTQVFECTGKLVAVSHRKPRVQLPPGASWQDYLATPLPEDETEEIAIDPLGGPTPLKGSGGKHSREDSVASFEGGKAGSAREQQHHDSQQQQQQQHTGAQQARKVAGKCWMAQNFPMSLRQLMPLLEVIGAANKHVGRAAAFMRRFSEVNLFPVKIQVPLAWTVYLLVSFRQFRFLPPEEGALAPHIFQVPAGFRKVTFEGLAEGGEQARRGSDAGNLDLGEAIQF